MRMAFQSGKIVVVPMQRVSNPRTPVADPIDANALSLSASLEAAECVSAAGGEALPSRPSFVAGVPSSREPVAVAT